MPVAVIDIGSNSIKILVADRTGTGAFTALKYKTLDARISAGISRDNPELSAEGMARGVAAVAELVADAAAFEPAKIVLVATSAVRDARNGGDFVAAIREATGHDVRILGGEEEANLIGRGLTCDPALAGARNFYLFDLGGGSLECLAFRERKITQAISLPLGCVRLTELCVNDPSRPFSEAERLAVADHVKLTLRQSGFRFDLPPDAAAIGTGGTLTTARAILAERRGKTLATSDTLLTVDELRELLNYVGRCDLTDRKRIPAMPAARADVFPTAIATVLAVADVGGLGAYWNSLYNLRWGVAAELLEQSMHR
ncbi:MAG TPA: phosphatase [Opitutaceae bacterium]|nr:phosphatase [Opitutaceae bacterium]